MKFNLRKKSGVNGTEIKILVLLSPGDVQGIEAVCDSDEYQLDKLRIDGTDAQRADHALLQMRVLIHYADLWSMRDNIHIRKQIAHGVQRKEFLKQQLKKRKRR